MNIEAIAFQAAQKTLASKKEVSLDALEPLQFIYAPKPVFRDDNENAVACRTVKFMSIDRIKSTLQNQPDDVKVYVHKLWILSEFGQDLEFTGKNFYHLRYGIRKN